MRTGLRLVWSASAEASRCDVLLVITKLDPGGTLEVLTLVVKELKALGLRVSIIALYRGAADAGTLRRLDCDVLIDREGLSLIGYAEAFLKMAYRIWATRPSSLLSFMPATNVMSTVVAALVGIRCRIASHHQPSAVQHGLLRNVDALLGAFGIYSRVIAVSESVRASFATYPKAYIRRVRVIPNAVAPISPSVDKLEIRKVLAAPPHTTLVAVVGRLAGQKNLLTTLAAAVRVPNTKVVLVGDGPQRPEIERFIASSDLSARVVLVGHLDHQAVIDILFAADVFVQLSLFEGRSIALLEALVAKKAILASDIEEQREVLRMDDGTLAGIVADPRDEDAITAALSALARSADLRLELGAKAGILAERLNPGRMGQDYLALLTRNE
jgi:glycosyltransferase involved in cell wall biosynthesis